MTRFLALLHSLTSYLAFLGVFLYAIGFVGGFGVPKAIDDGASEPLSVALLVNLGLLGLFAVQHSIMARPAFKRWWTRLVPTPIERSTFVLFASAALALLFWQWRPLPSLVWQIDAPAGRAILWGLFGLGWAIVLVSTFLISHAHLFGLAQAWALFRGRPLPTARFTAPGFYRHLRHPIMAGFLIAFWSTPTMSAGHLLFSLATTGYILIALQLEERDLVSTFGDQYRRYRRHVPMLVPRLRPADIASDRAAGRSEGAIGPQGASL